MLFAVLKCVVTEVEWS